MKKIKLYEGNLPVLSVACESIPEAYERMIKYIFDYGVDFSGNKSGITPSKEATISVTIGSPLKEPRYHRNFEKCKSTKFEMDILNQSAIENIVFQLTVDGGTRKAIITNPCTIIKENHFKVLWGRLLFDEENKPVFNMNGLWTEKEVYYGWYESVIKAIELQRIIADAISKKIEMEVRVGRYNEFIDSAYIDGECMDNNFLKTMMEFKTTNFMQRVI